MAFWRRSGELGSERARRRMMGRRRGSQPDGAGGGRGARPGLPGGRQSRGSGAAPPSRSERQLRLRGAGFRDPRAGGWAAELEPLDMAQPGGGGTGRNRGAASRARVRYLGVPGGVQKPPRVRRDCSPQGALGARRALPSALESSTQGFRFFQRKKKKKESLFPKRCVLPSASFPGTLAGSAGWRLLLLPGGPQGKAAFPERPAHLPGRRRYLQGCNLRCNFPASLRPAPRDAARARAPARRSAAPEPRGAARGRRAAPSRAPAAARRSLASPPGLREGRLAASSRVLGDRETVAVVSPLQI